MLLKYQENNLKKLKSELNYTNHISIIGKPKSGRKKVVFSLSTNKNIIIYISPNHYNYSVYGDFLYAVKEIKYFKKARKKLGIDLSLAGNLVGASFQLSSYDLYEIKNEIIKRIKKILLHKNIIFVIESPNLIDDGTKDILNCVSKIKYIFAAKHQILRIDICISDNESIGKSIYFESPPSDLNEFENLLYSLNMNPEIHLSKYILDFICKNSNGNIELIANIVNDINKKNIDVDFNTTDKNSFIKKLVYSSIQISQYEKELNDILTIISICDRHFSDVDLSFLIEEDLNIIELYLKYAIDHNLLYDNENNYFILLGIVKKIFSSSSTDKKRGIYNKIIKLICTYYPDQYKEKYRFSKMANHKNYRVYLLQYLMKMVRETGKLVSYDELTDWDKNVLNTYYSAYCKSRNNHYKQAVDILKKSIIEYRLISPISQEFHLLTSQCLIKSLDENDRNEAIEILSYNNDDPQIDEYLKYRIETRKIAACIHNGDYKRAKKQSQITIQRLINNIETTKSPGSEYYLNVLYRKYCNIHDYDSSIAVIKKSVKFFSSNNKYVTSLYIALINELALELIIGKNQDAYLTYLEINNLKENNFNVRFPRAEIFENNELILLIIKNDLLVNKSIIDRFNMLRNNTHSADHILISSNLAIALALYDDIDKAVSVLLEEYEQIKESTDKEGIYYYRIICNLAIMLYIQDNSVKDMSVDLLNKIVFNKDDPHYYERHKEYNLIIKTMKNMKQCSSIFDWIYSYQQGVDSPRNYYCLYEYGLVFTTLFDWDDE